MVAQLLKRRGIGLVVMMAALLTACDSGSSANSPQSAVSHWVKAVAGQEFATLVLYTCRGSNEDYEISGLFSGQLVNQLTDVNQQVNQSPLRLDLAGMSLDTTYLDENTATVQMSGEIRVGVRGGIERISVTGGFRLKYQDKRWKVCETM